MEHEDSSDLSPQSSMPSQTDDRFMHRLLRHRCACWPHAIVEHSSIVSSLLSKQSIQPSQRQRFSIHRPSLHWNWLVAHVQFNSSLPSAQSLSPSHKNWLLMQKLWFKHLNWSAAHVMLQFSSSEKSMQLNSPSHLFLPGMHRPFLHLWAVYVENKQNNLSDAIEGDCCNQL